MCVCTALSDYLDRTGDDTPVSTFPLNGPQGTRESSSSVKGRCPGCWAWICVSLSHVGLHRFVCPDLDWHTNVRHRDARQGGKMTDFIWLWAARYANRALTRALVPLFTILFSRFPWPLTPDPTVNETTQAHTHTPIPRRAFVSLYFGSCWSYRMERVGA